MTRVRNVIRTNMIIVSFILCLVSCTPQPIILSVILLCIFLNLLNADVYQDYAILTATLDDEPEGSLIFRLEFGKNEDELDTIPAILKGRSFSAQLPLSRDYSEIVYRAYMTNCHNYVYSSFATFKNNNAQDNVPDEPYMVTSDSLFELDAEGGRISFI